MNPHHPSCQETNPHAGACAQEGALDLELASLVIIRRALTADEVMRFRRVYPIVYRGNFDRVWGALWKGHVHPATIDELTQEVFTKFFCDVRTHGFPESIPAKLTSTAAGFAANARRKVRRDPVSLGPPSSGSEKPRSSPEIERVLDRAYAAQRLLLALKPKLRAAFVGVCIEGASHEDVAASLGIVRSTLELWLVDAKKQLARLAVTFLPPSQRGR